ncbi:MAG: NAD-dependent epimerase/dehydratase family protein [Proteobacteria bacterium]|nr:NAD-dependent epimerase/dehydratase family protein [Pseudomonadota bacterium]
MRKILITGAAGFVGRHITRRFLDFSDEVHAVDSVVPYTGGIDPHDGWPLFDPREYSNFNFYKEDCRGYFKRVNDDDFDYCFHLAAMVGGRLMIENNPLAVAEDLAIDSGYWQWAAKTRPIKSVCFSSSAAYPIKFQRKKDYCLLSEEMIEIGGDIGMPDMSYGWAKLTHEYLASLAYEKHGIKSVTYRPFSGYGEDQDDAYPFPSICKRAMKNYGKPILNVWGTGDQMRDFIHIEDCVDGILKTVDKIDDGSAINLSTGIYTSFKEFAKIAAEVCGYSPEVIGLSSKPAGVFARAGDTEKQRKLGFAHQIEFQTGIERAIEYYAK